jgi:RimJ/RimL family protein N-acetyltransferase
VYAVSLEIVDGKKYRFKDRDLRMLAEMETHPKVSEWNMYPQTNNLDGMHIPFREYLKALPRGEGQIFLIARLDGNIAGFLGIQCRKEGAYHIGNLGLSVHPNHWGKGIGTRLLQTAVESARKHQLRKLQAETLATNKPMLRIAEKAGFQVKKESKAEVKGKYRDKVFLERIVL